MHTAVLFIVLLVAVAVALYAQWHDPDYATDASNRLNHTGCMTFFYAMLIWDFWYNQPDSKVYMTGICIVFAAVFIANILFGKSKQVVLD